MHVHFREQKFLKMERPKLSLRDETKALINSILIPHPAGMFLNAFVREFFNAERRELPYKLVH